MSGRGVKFEDTSTPLQTRFDWSPGIFGDCYCDMTAQLIPGIQLSWNLGISPSWPVVGRALSGATFATIEGTIENPLGINLSVYEQADAFLSSTGEVGIGVKVLPAVFDYNLAGGSFNLYSARTENLFA